MSQEYSLSQHNNGNRLLTDKETGLLYVNSVNGFTLLKKKKFIEIAPKYWPDISLICQFVGIVKNTYRNHYMHDKVFREKMDELNESTTDKIEASLAQYATEKGNFMDRIAWLRAHRGEKYNEKKMLQVDVTISKDQLAAKKASLSQAIDAEIVEQEIAAPIKQEIKQELK